MGKGSKRRPMDEEKFGKNFAKAFPRRQKLPDGKYVLIDGEWVPASEAFGSKKVPVQRKHDSVRIRSISSGVAVDQVPEATAKLRHLGVKFDPRTGDAIYPNRNAKLRALKARGMYDKDEVRG